MLITDWRTVLAAGVFADIPAAVKQSCSSSVGRKPREPSCAEDPAGPHGYNTWTGSPFIPKLKMRHLKKKKTGHLLLQLIHVSYISQCCNRDTRLLAATALAMLINTTSESRAGGAAAWNLLQVSHRGTAFNHPHNKL